jgi:cyanophycinase
MKLHSFTKGVLLLGASLFSQMTLAACLTAEVEPNNADTSANTGVCSGTAIAGKISTTSDNDWYKLDVTAAGVINISLSHASGIDLDWFLYPATGSYVAYRSTSSNPETGSYTAPAAGTYYIRVKSYTGSGTYTLNATFNGTITEPPPPVPVGVVTGKVWLNGGSIAQENTGIFVTGLRQATGKNYNVPNMSITTNCDTNWNTTPCPRVAIITAAAANQASGVDKYTNDLGAAWSYANLFQRHGFAPKHILSHHDTYATNSSNATATGQANIAIINQADVVYVIGGDQSRLARTFLNNDGSDSALMAAMRTRYNAGALIYAGDSAGTAIAPSISYGEGISIGYLNQNTLRSITPADCPYVSATAPSCLTSPTADFGTKIKGFGFIPNANVDTHFDNRNSKTGRLGRLLAALKNIGPQVAYGIDQNTALYVNGDIATVFGTSGVYVGEATSSNFPAGSKFTAAGVRISYLTAGDTFKFSDRSITSTKTKLIGSAGVAAQFSTALNSSDIFAVDANGLGNSSATIKHMIDQTPVSSTGTAPKDTANGDPLSFTLTFKKDSVSKGYKNATGTYNGPYTIVKALVDVN